MIKKIVFLIVYLLVVFLAISLVQKKDRVSMFLFGEDPFDEFE